MLSELHHMACDIVHTDTRARTKTNTHCLKRQPVELRLKPGAESPDPSGAQKTEHHVQISVFRCIRARVVSSR